MEWWIICRLNKRFEHPHFFCWSRTSNETRAFHWLFNEPSPFWFGRDEGFSIDHRWLWFSFHQFSLHSLKRAQSHSDHKLYRMRLFHFKHNNHFFHRFHWMNSNHPFLMRLKTEIVMTFPLHRYIPFSIAFIFIGHRLQFHSSDCGHSAPHMFNWNASCLYMFGYNFCLNALK